MNSLNVINNASRNQGASDMRGQGASNGWCPPGRTAKNMNGVCYCDYKQYSVKPRCLSKEPDCFVINWDNGYTYYGQDTGAYITHGKNRIES